jgi:hypothetical protein
MGLHSAGWYLEEQSELNAPGLDALLAEVPNSGLGI